MQNNDFIFNLSSNISFLTFERIEICFNRNSKSLEMIISLKWKVSIHVLSSVFNNLYFPGDIKKLPEPRIFFLNFRIT